MHTAAEGSSILESNVGLNQVDAQFVLMFLFNSILRKKLHLPLGQIILHLFDSK